MRVVIIQQEEDIKRLSISEKDVVMTLNPQLKGVLEKRGIKCRVPDYRLAAAQSINWMKSWPDKDPGGKNFKEIFSYKDLSIWWLMENWLYYSPIWPLRPLLETIAALKPVLGKTKREIVFVDDGSPVSEAIRLVAGKRPISINEGRIKAKAHAMRIFFDASYLLRNLSWGILSAIHKQKNGRGDVILFSVYDWEILRKGEKIVRQDTYIAPLIKCLRKENVKIIGIPVGRFLGLRNIKDKLLSGLKFNVLENYAYDKKELRKTERRLKEDWEQLKANGQFAGSFEFCGVDAWPLVKPQFDAYFIGRLKSHLRDFMLLESLVEAEQPKVMVYPAEMSEFGREIFYLCNASGIKSIGIQHGIFGNRLNVYHTKKELSGDYACAIPTKTCVYGSAFMDILVNECNYPTDSVVVTGSQRFDRIAQEGEDIRKALGVQSEKKIIALITSPVSRTENEALIRAVFSAAKNFRDTQLVVKIHPNESDSLYKEMKQELGSDAIIVRDIDLYDVLKSCDAAITYLSTAGIEAILLKKPLIVINLTGKPDVVPYVSEGVAMGVYREEDLFKAMKTALYGRWKFENGMNRFVMKYAHKNDGRASERICRLIKQLMI